MRFLCLHGAGTSAAIFKNQTAAFRAKLKIDPPPTFDFINGPYSSSPAAGINLFYPPPYYSFFAGASPAALASAHAWLLELLDRDGPYDVVMTFSQGGALASTLLLTHAVNGIPPPFKAAVFICSGMPLPMLADFGIPISDKAREWDESSRQQLSAQADNAAILSAGRDRWTGVTVKGELSLNTPGKEIPDTDVFGLDFSQIPRSYRIDIPTVHIYGGRDPRFPASMQLARFCEEEGGRRREFDHGTGHEIPRNRAVSDRIAGLVEWVMGEAEKDGA
ncbi:hypothetical protein MMC30_007586 [Trapelia coarctata]|nr:hypothetical protein [Trapelia coarctata]